MRTGQEKAGLGWVRVGYGVMWERVMGGDTGRGDTGWGDAGG